MGHHLATDLVGLAGSRTLPHQLVKRAGVEEHGAALVELFGVQPHRQRSFRLSNDPFFVEKVRDIVGLYLDPPDNAVVLRVDEKSQIRPF